MRPRRWSCRGWLSQGPEVAAFESAFAEQVGRRSCLRGIELHDGSAFGAAGRRRRAGRRGDHRQLQLHRYRERHQAVRCDSRSSSTSGLTTSIWTPSSWRLPSPRTRAVLCVHQIGMPCDLQRIVTMARAIRRPVDRGCRLRHRQRDSLIDGTWQAIGAPHGDVACFSFHPRKVVTTGDGGMITTATQTGIASSASGASTA